MSDPNVRPDPTVCHSHSSAHPSGHDCRLMCRLPNNAVPVSKHPRARTSILLLKPPVKANSSTLEFTRNTASDFVKSLPST